MLLIANWIRGRAASDAVLLILPSRADYTEGVNLFRRLWLHEIIIAEGTSKILVVSVFQIMSA